jgi:hypothetical protein
MDSLFDWGDWLQQDDPDPVSLNFQLPSDFADTLMMADTEPGSPVTSPPHPTYGDLGHRAAIQSFSISQALDLLRRGHGNLYYVPSGYIPILVPDPAFPGDVLGYHVPTIIPSDRLWKRPLPAKKQKPPAKKPPRPPNSFILYRKEKQV